MQTTAKTSVNADHLSEFYERAGFRVARSPGANWFVPGKRIYRSFPAGRLIAPSAEEISALANHPGILGVEFVNADGIGLETGLWTLRDSDYDLHSLQRQFRRHVVQALAFEGVREIDFDDLCRLGTAVNLETLARQRREDRHFSDPTLWRQMCDAGKRTNGAGVFASMDSHRITAYLVYFIVGDTCHGLFSKSLTHARTAGANHALYFTYSQTMIRRLSISVVTTGPQSIPPIETIDRFKRHAGYRLEKHHCAAFLRSGARALLLNNVTGAALWAGQRLVGRSALLLRARSLRQAVRVSIR